MTGPVVASEEARAAAARQDELFALLRPFLDGPVREHLKVHAAKAFVAHSPECGCESAEAHAENQHTIAALFLMDAMALYCVEARGMTPVDVLRNFMQYLGPKLQGQLAGGAKPPSEQPS